MLGHGTAPRPERRDWPTVAADIRLVVHAGHEWGALVKVIFENSMLEDVHKERLCHICGEVGADFVKTSTGYGASGATDDDLRLMRRCSPPHVQVLRVVTNQPSPSAVRLGPVTSSSLA